MAMKPKGYIIKLLLPFLIIYQTLVAQTSTGMKGYIPPSPNAQTFLKYGDYPVDYSTGVPSINIPLYTISLKDYSFPISASFHASGRMASLNFSPLGLNWALHATGVISREVKGIPDEKATHTENPASYYSPQSAHFQDLYNLENGTKDPEYDIFSLDVNGLSFKFIIRDNHQVVFLAYCPYKLIVNGVTFSSFTLVDDKGITYNFGSDGNGYGFAELNSNVGTTSWFLSSIVTPSGNILQFKYASQSTSLANDAFFGNFSYTDLVTVADAPSSYPNIDESSSDIGTPHRTNVTPIEDYTMGYLTEIDFDNGKVLFTYDPSNLTLLGCQVINNFSANKVKDIVFSYFNIPGTTSSLNNNNTKTIQNILFKDNNGIIAERYGFDYYPGSTPSQFTFGRQKDYWGYSNGRVADGQGSNYIPVPTMSITSSTSTPVAAYDLNLGCRNCREPDFNAKVVGMIRKIYYPTGGNSEFIYESNYYNDPYSAVHKKEGPGIRVKQIIANDGLGNKTVKTYKYGNSEDEMGQLIWTPRPEDYVTATRKNFINPPPGGQAISSYDYGFTRNRVYSSEPVAEVQKAMRLPVYYYQVTEYNSSKITPAVNGKTVYNYTAPTSSRPYTTVEPELPFYVQNFNFDTWSGPNLSSKTIYKYDKSINDYKPLSSVVNSYQTYNSISIPQANIYRFHEFPNESGGQWTKYFIETNNWQVYYPLDKTITSAVMKLTNETTTEYDNNGNTIVTSSSYDYNNLVHVNPTSIKTSKSNKKDIITYINYPQDYAAGTTFIDDLKSKNIIAPIEKVVTQVDGSNTAILSGEISTYKNGGKGLVDQTYKTEIAAPLGLSSFKFSNRAVGVLPSAGSATVFSMDGRYKPKITYNLYDANSNPLLITPYANMPVSYVWGYNNTYPVAEVKNAVNKNVFYTSFEEPDANSITGGKTGLISHNGCIKTVSGIDNGNYILSYWLKNTTGWTLQSNKISVTANSYTINISGQIDELRFYPENGAMTTYTYEPFVGMTSSTNSNNQTTYYEYDGYKRLKTIRDNNQNILKQISYSLVNPSFFSEVQSGTFTKAGCGPDYLGSQVTYTVPAGTYSSNISLTDANAKALADISGKGQTYANDNGVCYNYKNSVARKVFIKACSSGLYGSEIEYMVPYGKYTSIISAADADAKATNDLNANGQNYANTLSTGRCYTYDEAFKNAARSETLYRSNCPFGYSGSPYPYNPYTIGYGKYVSTVSQDAANNKASFDLLAKQDEVNNTCSCSAIPLVLVQVSNSTHYDFTISFSNSTGSMSYTSVQGNFYGTVSVPEGTYNAIRIDPNASTDNTFHFYLGGVMKLGGSASYNNTQPANISISN
jgi:YD repeat-containing protein